MSVGTCARHRRDRGCIRKILLSLPSRESTMNHTRSDAKGKMRLATMLVITAPKVWICIEESSFTLYIVDVRYRREIVKRIFSN